MSKLSKLRDTIYNKVWHAPKGKFSSFLRGKCDELPHKQRLMVVGIMLTLFVLIAFIVFGHACYNIGLGHARQIEIEHIRQLDLPTKSDGNVETPLSIPYDD